MKLILELILINFNLCIISPTEIDSPDSVILETKNGSKYVAKTSNEKENTGFVGDFKTDNSIQGNDYIRPMLLNEDLRENLHHEGGNRTRGFRPKQGRVEKNWLKSQNQGQPANCQRFKKDCGYCHTNTLYTGHISKYYPDIWDLKNCAKKCKEDKACTHLSLVNYYAYRHHNNFLPLGCTLRHNPKFKTSQLHVTSMKLGCSKPRHPSSEDIGNQYDADYIMKHKSGSIEGTGACIKNYILYRAEEEMIYDGIKTLKECDKKCNDLVKPWACTHFSWVNGDVERFAGEKFGREIWVNGDVGGNAGGEIPFRCWLMKNPIASRSQLYVTSGTHGCSYRKNKFDLEDITDLEDNAEPEIRGPGGFHMGGEGKVNSHN